MSVAIGKPHFAHWVASSAETTPYIANVITTSENLPILSYSAPSSVRMHPHLFDARSIPPRKVL